jgi:phage terminase large subunit
VTAVQIPYQPRPLQREVGKLIRAKRFGVLVCHRRFGKTVLGVNMNQQAALMCRFERPRAAYIGPTYTQGKAIAWDYMQHYARSIPGVAMNQSELRIDYPNKGQARIFGADNPDALRGIYLDRAVLDEYGLHPAKTFSEVIGPTLVDRGGSALFLGTPTARISSTTSRSTRKPRKPSATRIGSTGSTKPRRRVCSTPAISPAPPR